MSLIPRPFLDSMRAAFREWHNSWGHVYPHEATQTGIAASTVTDESAGGESAAPGSATTYSRGDHGHGNVALATAAETTAGADAGRVVTPDGLAGSKFGERGFQITVIDYTIEVTTGDGKAYLHIDSRLAGMNLVDVHAEVITAGTTNNTDIQIRNVTQAQDMLSTVMRIETGETATDTSAQPGTIDGTKDDVAENDLLAVDVDAVQTTKPKGLIITLGFRLP